MPLDIFFQYDNFVFIYFFICLFVQTLTNAFMGYTNAALMRFATTPKVHTIAYAIMDSREMDGNVKVVVGSLNNYAIKKKLTFANHAQRNGNLNLDPLSKKIYSENERR